MQRRIGTLLLAVSAILFGGLPAAFAVNSPNAPANVSATSNSAANALTTAGTLSVTWQKPVVDATHPIPIAYIVTATAGSEVVSVTVPLATVATTDYSTVVSGLTGGTAYSVTVTSKTSENATTTSTAVNATPITSPATPSVVSSVATPGSVALTWSAPSNNGGSALTGYIIKDGTGAETSISDAAATTKTFSGLTAGSTASYSIRAKNANGNSEWVAFASVTLPSAPDKPTSVTATAGTNSITVSWVAPAITGNSAITGYKVYLYDSAGAAVGSAKSVTTTTTELLSITAGTYSVKVSAVNLVGESALSAASLSVTIAAPSALLDNTPTFTPSTLPNLVIGSTQSISVSVPSNGDVAITATGTPSGACTYATGTLTAVAEGTCSVRATSPATTTYAEAIGTKTFTITKTLQTITFASIANQPLPGPLTVTATSTSGLTVAFSASGNCTVTGRTVSFTAEGTCSVTASQAGDTTYAAATSVVRTFSITAEISSGGGSGGGGSGGGGYVPAPVPTVIATPNPTPAVSPSATPSAMPTVKQTPSATPTASPNPTVSSSPKASSGLTTKTNSFVVSNSGSIVGPVKSSTLNTGASSVSIKSNTNFQPMLPVVAKGAKVTMVITDSKGRSYTVAAITATKAGSLKLPAVKFSQSGKYTITIKVGSKTKIVKVTSSK